MDDHRSRGAARNSVSRTAPLVIRRPRRVLVEHRVEHARVRAGRRSDRRRRSTVPMIHPLALAHGTSHPRPVSGTLLMRIFKGLVAGPLRHTQFQSPPTGREGTMSIPEPSSTGTVGFRGCEVWYRVTGDRTSGKAPLVVLHGGP